MHAFEYQDSRQTLEQGIAGYYQANPGLARARDLASAEAREFFRCHDAAHVLFGCGTALPDEAVVKVSSIFGTTAGLTVLGGYRLHESVEIYKRLRAIDVLRCALLSVILVPRAIARCARQLRRWPWSDFEAYSQTPLADIRWEFGIRVAHSGADDRQSASSG